MAFAQDSWMKEYHEAIKLMDDINAMISERSLVAAAAAVPGTESRRQISAIWRKIMMSRSRIDSLHSSLLAGKQPRMTEKETNRWKDMVADLQTKLNQMASTFNKSSNMATRNSLLGTQTTITESAVDEEDTCSATSIKLDKNCDNDRNMVELQRQVMKEQDESLERLENIIIRTKHIALEVNDEIDLHTRLIDDLDEHVEITKDSHIRRLQKSLARLKKQINDGSWSSLQLLISVIVTVVLVLIAYMFIKTM